MTIFKPKNYNAIKNEINDGTPVTMQPVQNGYVGKVVYNYIDTTVTPNATYPAAFVPLTPADLLTDNIWVVLCTPLEQDLIKTKLADSNYSLEYIKEKGEQVRVFNVSSLQMTKFEFTSNIVKDVYTAVNVDDVLVPTTDGSMMWMVSATPTTGGMKVIAKDNLSTGSMYFGTQSTGSFLTYVVTQ